MVGQDEKDMISALDADKIAYKRMPDDAGLHTIKVVGPGAWGTVDWDDVWVRLVAGDLEMSFDVDPGERQHLAALFASALAVAAWFPRTLAAAFGRLDAPARDAIAQAMLAAADGEDA